MNMIFGRHAIFWVGLCMSVGLCACTALMAAPQKPAADDSVALLQSIRKEIGDAACNSDAQCHVIGIGAKPCGGPDAFLAWSDRVSDRSRLLDLVSRHRAARQRENESSGIASDCSISPEPQVVCRPVETGRAAVGERRQCLLVGTRRSPALAP